MFAAARAWVTAGAALVGAGAVSVTPGPPVTGHVSVQHYSLAASSSGLANVPANLVNLALSVPAWETQALNRLAAAMTATGSWQVWGPTNVVGFDEQDPPKLRALVDVLIPIQPLSSALGDQLSWWATANLPMNPGCAAQPGACPQRGAFMATAMKVPMSQLYAGYRFPTVTNPFTGEQTSWSGQYVKLERGAAASALRGFLTAPPAGVAKVAPGEFLGAVAATGRSVRDAFYPFVQNSEWFNGSHLGLAPLFRRLAPALCPSCNPDKPYDNPWLYEHYAPNTSAPAAAAVRSRASRAAAAEQGPRRPGATRVTPDVAGRAGAETGG